MEPWVGVVGTADDQYTESAGGLEFLDHLRRHTVPQRLPRLAHPGPLLVNDGLPMPLKEPRRLGASQPLQDDLGHLVPIQKTAQGKVQDLSHHLLGQAVA